MTSQIPFVKSFAGLNTRIDPVRIKYDAQTGVSEMAVAVNITIDDTGMAETRYGFTLETAGNMHSGFCDGGDCFAILERTSDAAIIQIAPDLTYGIVATGLNKFRTMSWTQANYDTFYSNGIQNGYIRAGVRYVWPVETYAGPELDLLIEAAPVADIVAFKLGGLMFLSVGDALIHNEFPYHFGMYCWEHAMRFESAIRMIRPVDGGVFVSDSNFTWFLAGNNWKDFQPLKVAPYPAHSFSATQAIIPSDIGLESTGNCYVWSSPEGICLGLADGSFKNLTREKHQYPSTHTQAASLFHKGLIINTMVD